MAKKSSTFPKIVVVLGPTASGKSDLAIKLAKKFNGEIISADSRQVYRGMDIGTAKPPLVQCKMRHVKAGWNYKSYSCLMSQENIRHYLIDIKNPNQNYTVAQYKKDAIMAIKKVLAKNKLPILCGGTGLYIKAVIDNLEIPQVKPNPRLRQKLEKELSERGLKSLYEKLIKLDPEAVYIIDKNNPRRVIRALEIILQTKRPFSSQRAKDEKMFNALKIGLKLPPEKLKQKIEKRVDEMTNDGLIEEVKNLLKKYPPNLSVFDAIGYREIINHLQGKISLQEATSQIKINTWHYAKRQITWFKTDKEIIWLDPHTNKGLNYIVNLCKEFLYKK